MPSEEFFEIAKKARELDESYLDEVIERKIKLREETRQSILLE